MDLVRVGVVDHEPGPLSHLAKMAVCVVEVPAVDEEQDKRKKVTMRMITMRLLICR